jgi:hypothetical protein
VVEGWAGWASFGFNFPGWRLPPHHDAGRYGGVQAARPPRTPAQRRSRRYGATSPWSVPEFVDSDLGCQFGDVPES